MENLLTRLTPAPAVVQDLYHTIQLYPYQVDWQTILRLGLSFFFLFWLPGFLLALILFQDDLDYLEKVALGFPLSATLAVLVAFFFKFSGIRLNALSYELVFGSFSLALGAAAVLWKGWPKIKPKRPGRPNYVVLALMLGLLFLAFDFALRSVGSYAFLLGGDAPTQYILATETLRTGPFPDGFPFLKEFTVSWYHSGFPYLLAVLKTTSGTSLLAVFRYFPVLVQAPVLIAFFALVKTLTKNSLVALLSVLFLLGFSRGPEGNEVPVLILPLAWATGWSLFAASLLLFIRSIELDRVALCVYGGLIAGANSLVHLLDSYRLIMIIAFFLVLILLAYRKFPRRESLFFVLLAAVVAVVFCLWAAPLYLKYGYWEQVSWDVIRSKYGDQLSEIIKMRSSLPMYRPPLMALGKVFADNIGTLLALFLPVGFYYLVKEKSKEKWLVLGWFLSLFLLTRLPALDPLQRAYRHYEYVFLAGVVISSIGILGLGRSISDLSKKEGLRRLVFTLFLGTAVVWHAWIFIMPRYASYVKYPYPVPIPRDTAYEGPVWRDWFAAQLKGERKVVLPVGLDFDFIALSEQYTIAESKFLGLRMPSLWQRWSDYVKLTSAETPAPLARRLLEKYDVSYIAIGKDQKDAMERFKAIARPAQIYRVGSVTVLETDLNSEVK